MKAALGVGGPGWEPAVGGAAASFAKAYPPVCPRYAARMTAGMEEEITPPGPLLLGSEPYSISSKPQYNTQVWTGLG